MIVRPIVAGLYEAAAQVARALSAVAPAGGSKLQQTLHARKGILDRYARWSQHRDARRPLLWMHAPSVGEGLQARPVLEIVRRERPEVQLVYTHFSPSAERFADALDVDFHDYLPFDVAGDAERALELLRPAALIFSKLDVWPSLTARAASRRIPLGLVSATVSPGSARNRNPVRWLMQPTYAQLNLVGAVAPDHAQRLVQLGVRPQAVRITGDTRYDQVWARAQSVDRSSNLLRDLTGTRPTLVAGSTWPTDEAILLPAWTALQREVPAARMIIAPHEPTPEHVASLERQLSGTGLTHARLSSAGAKDADVVIVDRIGVLGELYALGSVAFVGGGFHAAGLHSVLEPAAYALPVLHGPRFTNSRDAVLLVERGGSAAASSVEEMTRALRRWLAAGDDRDAAGDRAQSIVKEGLGAARRSADIVLELLDQKPR